MPCKDWYSLLQRYRSGVRAYDDAVARLPDEPSPDFNQSWHRAEVTRTEVGVARAALLQHEHRHGCATNRPSNREAVSQTTEEWVLGDQGQSGG